MVSFITLEGKKVLFILYLAVTDRYIKLSVQYKELPIKK